MTFYYCYLSLSSTWCTFVAAKIIVKRNSLLLVHLHTHTHTINELLRKRFVCNPIHQGS